MCYHQPCRNGTNLDQPYRPLPTPAMHYSCGSRVHRELTEKLRVWGSPHILRDIGRLLFLDQTTRMAQREVYCGWRCSLRAGFSPHRGSTYQGQVPARPGNSWHGESSPSTKFLVRNANTPHGARNFTAMVELVGTPCWTCLGSTRFIFLYKILCHPSDLSRLFLIIILHRIRLSRWNIHTQLDQNLSLQRENSQHG